MNTLVESDQIDQSETIDINTEPGKFYVVLGDCLLGYYLVKCLSSDEDHFYGKYLSICSESVQSAPSNMVIFKETNEKDNFDFESLLSEVLVMTEVVNKKRTRFAIDKEDLNDILVAVGEMNDK